MIIVLSRNLLVEIGHPLLHWNYLLLHLEIPNDAYTKLSQYLIGFPTLSQEYCQLIG